MKNLKKLMIAAVFVVLTAFNLHAQTTAEANQESETGFRIGVGFGLIYPLGNSKDRYDGGYSFLVQAEFPLASKYLYLTAASGYENIFGKEDELDNPVFPDIKRIPAKVGVKFFPIKNLYLHGEAGASFLTNKPDFRNGNSVAFIFAPQIGYQIPLGDKNSLDLGVRYESTGKHYSGGNSTNYFGFKLLYAFSL